MKRRQFLKYTTLSTTGLIVAACADKKQTQTETTVNFGSLEKTHLNLGYLPSTEITPLIIAQEKGFFSRYGLKVGLTKQISEDELEKRLTKGKLDGAIVSAALPLSARLGKNNTPMVSLMTVNLNGSAITLDKKAWNGGIRPGIDYISFQEFAANYRQYIRQFKQMINLGIPGNFSINNYLYRYWLAAMGIQPDREVKFNEISPSQMLDKLQAGIISGYCAAEPWNQKTVWQKTGFIAYISRDIWQGHPGQILATIQPFIDNNPTTARALVAAMIEACKYCDQLENRPEIAQIISQKKYINVNLLAVEPALIGQYNYQQIEEPKKQKTVDNFDVFNRQNTNYPWRSHGVWLLTQMIRWAQLELREYPKDADKILDQIYALDIYEDVAKALQIEVPKEKMKKEPATTFIDRREFEPSQPVAYLNSFELRAKGFTIIGT